MSDQQQQPNGDRMDRVERGLDRLVSVQGEHQTRLDRIERDIEGVIGLIRQLAQHADQRFEQLTQAQQQTDESLSALIQIVDGVIRKPPPHAS